MPRFILMLICVAIPLTGLRGDPPVNKEISEVRPVLWWTDVGRVSDSGGPAFKPHTKLCADAKTFANFWANCKLKGDAPQVNFKDHFVVVAFRESGVDFQIQGGLSLTDKGDATVFGFPAHHIVTNAGWYSTTIGVFPRKGVVSVERHKLPAADE